MLDALRVRLAALLNIEHVVWRMTMKSFAKALGLLLASVALASCGGGGGNGGTFSPPQTGTITLTATTTTLPTNTGGYLPHEHGPNQAEVNISLRNANGTLLSGGDVSVSISPVTVAAISVLADGTATNDDLWGTYTIKGTNGQATAWVNARDTAGTAVFTASAVDPGSNTTISATLTFTVTTGVGPNPSTISLVPNPSSVYLPDAGGSSSTITATVRDGGGQFVPDPAGGNNAVDNIQFEIVGDAGGATLSTSSATGNGSGTSVTTHTVRGVASATFQTAAATPQGPVQIRATVDRADNNVSNGIQDAVSVPTSIVVSDGKLFSIVITSPSVDSLQVNPPASGDVTFNPDGTYSLTVSAQAQDQQGRPVPAGTPIAFGAIDGPLVGFPANGSGQFAISGNDGNPQEGGTLFTAPTGQFTTAGGGARPGDTLLVRGDQVAGNTDLTSARIVANVNSGTSLNVSRPFNPNTAGGSVDYGPVLPYVIGRAEAVNITGSALTNDVGVATVQMTYPVSQLGRAVYIWAQGNGAELPNGNPRIVSAIKGYGFAGEAPATLSASPSPLAGNTTTTVLVCLNDARTEAIQGVFINFSFAGVGGDAIIDGQSGSGTLLEPTDASGCTTGSVTTSGIAAAGTPTVLFSTGGLSTSIPIKPVGNGILIQVSPSALSPSGGSVAILVTGSNGEPQANVAISVACSGGVSSSIPPPTNSSGQSSAGITNPGLSGGTGGSCVFTAGGTGGPTATVVVTAPPDDGGTTPTEPVTLTVTLVPPTAPPPAGPFTVTSSPAGITCSAATSTVTCSSPFAPATVVTLSANVAPRNWTGGCAVTAADPKKAVATMSSAQTCTANF